MNSDIELKCAISANVEFYSEIIGGILFWGSIPMAIILSEQIGNLMMSGAMFLLAVKLINNKLILGKWFG